jgi:hypothetical protein
MDKAYANHAAPAVAGANAALDDFPAQSACAFLQAKNSCAQHSRKKACLAASIVACVLVVPLVLTGLYFAIKWQENPGQPVSLFGITPIIVNSDSAESDTSAGDLILCTGTTATNVAEGDLIAFFDPASSGSSVITQRVAAVITDDDGSLSFRMQEDVSSTSEPVTISANTLIGQYYTRIPGAGIIAAFLFSLPGVVVCVVVPVVLLLLLDTLRRWHLNGAAANEMRHLQAELLELSAIKVAT